MQDMHRLCLCLANSLKLLGPTLLHQAAPSEGEANRCFRAATPEHGNAGRTSLKRKDLWQAPPIHATTSGLPKNFWREELCM